MELNGIYWFIMVLNGIESMALNGIELIVLNGIERFWIVLHGIERYIMIYIMILNGIE